MCGRFVVAKTAGEILTIFEADEIIGEQPGISYNVAPTQPISIVVDRAFEKAEDGSPLGELHREIHAARWGLIPRWSKDGPSSGAPLVNGRIETILEKPSFKDSVIRRRCVIPASGYYEWHVDADGNKQPFYINAGSDGMFALAGLYEWWRDPSKAENDPTRWLLSATTLTKASAPELAHIHDRNPVLLTPDALEAWIDPHIEGDQDLLDAVAAESDVVAAEAEFFKVGAAVGQVRNNSAELILPL
ncbi:MAG: SOS response-associated peptidase [Actinomycetales bacterium]|nr:SOS response-associated peptidase [Actinomycetales bacterium]